MKASDLPGERVFARTLVTGMEMRRDPSHQRRGEYIKEDLARMLGREFINLPGVFTITEDVYRDMLSYDASVRVVHEEELIKAIQKAFRDGINHEKNAHFYGYKG